MASREWFDRLCTMPVACLQFRITKGGVTIINVPLISLKATKTASATKSPKPTPSASKSKPALLQVRGAL